LFTGGAEMQIGSDIVSLPGVTVVTNLESALAALDTIVEQGEGAPADADNSHYERFKQIACEYDSLTRQRAGFQPARAVARNPVMRAPQKEEDRVHVNAPEAATVLDLANALYNQMLRVLTQAFGRRFYDDRRDRRRELMDAAVSLMGLLAAVSEYLTTLPAGRRELERTCRSQLRHVACNRAFD